VWNPPNASSAEPSSGQANLPSEQAKKSQYPREGKRTGY
jgi:hypothetical protein